jgi:transcriptional repressor NrdR
MVVKKNGVRQPFDVKKIKSGVIKACEKRPVSMAEIDKLADDIQKRVMNSLDQEISSKEIGEMIMDSLKKIDEIAYVRFASVYRQFKDINTFLTEIERLMTREAGNTENAAVKFDKKEDA